MSTPDRHLLARAECIGAIFNAYRDGRLVGHRPGLDAHGNTHADTLSDSYLPTPPMSTHTPSSDTLLIDVPVVVVVVNERQQVLSAHTITKEALAALVDTHRRATRPPDKPKAKTLTKTPR